jgi:phospholipid-binding lipoprotein MlaA
MPAEGNDFDAFEDEFEVESAAPVRDPLRGYNRLMFTVNDRLYHWVMKPVARVYGWVVPEPVRCSVNRAAENLDAPVRLVNSVLQGKFAGAGSELARFGLNSTLGVVGMFDAADVLFGLEPCDEDFGQTLGRYGVGEGWPLTLPLLGPSNIRDTLGRVPDSFLRPLHYAEAWEEAAGVRVFQVENYLSLHIGEYESLMEDALDPYTFLRDAYRQRRRASVER